jgi:hypothetical protein
MNGEHWPEKHWSFIVRNCHYLSFTFIQQRDHVGRTAHNVMGAGAG